MKNNYKTTVIMDVDTGIDDALALVMACKTNVLNILGITTVAGNVDLEKTLSNTMNVLNLLGRTDIPVAKGSDRPLKRSLMKASSIHGESGLRGYKFRGNHTKNLVDDLAWDFMYEKIMKYEGRTTILALGPVTNIAKLLIKYPSVKSKIEKIVFMGTSWRDGNPSPIATFNVLVDPEAFDYVVRSGLEFHACPLDTSRKATINSIERKAILSIGNKVARFSYSIIDNYGTVKNNEISNLQIAENKVYVKENNVDNSDGVSLHDPMAVAYVIAPELFTVNKYYCEVECEGKLTTGFTLIDKANWYNKSDKEKNIYFVESINRTKFVELFYNLVSKY